MYVKHIKIQNFGTISNLDITPKFDENNNPLPTIIVGKNGAGKTLLIGNILDGIIELKRKKYTKLKEVGANLLKIGLKSYIKVGCDFSYINILFEHNGDNSNYTDFMTIVKGNKFTQDKNLFPNVDWNNSQFLENGYFKEIKNSNSTILDAFENNIFLFFPHSRYDHPAWLNKQTEIGFRFNERFVNESDSNIIKNDVLKEIETWILDCLLDREIYEKNYINLPLENIPNSDTPSILPHFNGYLGKNNNILTLLNELLLIIYKSKYPDIQQARIGVGAKNRRNISIHITEKNGIEKNISPSFSHLSSGEVMLLALFASILKEYDSLGLNTEDLSEICGIVIIDEVDLHLHIEFQKQILPELIKRFSKIQFFITTHSPFFLLGMDELYGSNCNIINLPFGNKIEVSDFSEIQDGYNVFVNGFNQMQNTFNKVSEELKKITKPLIITEGKTDWKHIKNALLKAQNEGRFTDIDVEFLEYEDEIEMGDTHLKSLCEQTAKMKNGRKVICIFDNDSPSIIKEMSGDTVIGYKDWNNLVYSFCIPTPNHRTNYKNISIEFYYTDDEIKTIDKDTNRRLLFTNEVEEVIRKSKTTKTTKKEILVLSTPKPEEEFEKKIFDESVESICDNQGNKIAHSKSVFATNILTKKESFDNFDTCEFDNILCLIQKIANN